MNIKPIKLDANQEIIEPLLHDADVISIMKEKNDNGLNVRLRLRAEVGALFSLVLIGVSKFNVQDFTVQNIVLDGAVLTGGGHERTLMEFKDEMGWSNEAIKAIAADLKKGAKKIFILNPSVGCSVLALCQDVQIEG